ncbi:DUF4435 domain-containing protein [Paraburkholderia sp. RL17-381-BIF-C]|uniref:DUF4435 domain-containing protein n=1 Tax=Paraburkholderia sp. RL17-381-BIF-C TaxID=3031635 RepID=UPI0038B9B0EB
MDRVNYFSDLLESEAPLFKKYVSRRKKWKTDAVFVFEGDDEKYYSSVIGTIFSTEYHGFVSGSRGNSIALHKALASNDQLSDDVTYFFIDRDFVLEDDLSEKVYVTSGHSIETYYCDELAVKRMIRSEAGLGKAKNEHADEDEVLADVMSLYGRFHAELMKSRELKKANILLFLFSATGSELKLNLNQNISLVSQFYAHAGFVRMTVSLTVGKHLSAILNQHVRGRGKELFSMRSHLKDFRENPICRGKQELEFLREFLVSCGGGVLHRYVKDKFGYSVSLRFNGGSSDLLSFGAQYAIKPQKLIDFINHANLRAELARKNRAAEASAGCQQQS